MKPFLIVILLFSLSVATQSQAVVPNSTQCAEFIRDNLQNAGRVIPDEISNIHREYTEALAQRAFFYSNANGDYPELVTGLWQIRRYSFNQSLPMLYNSRENLAFVVVEKEGQLHLGIFKPGQTHSGQTLKVLVKLQARLIEVLSESTIQPQDVEYLDEYIESAQRPFRSQQVRMVAHNLNRAKSRFGAYKVEAHPFGIDRVTDYPTVRVKYDEIKDTSFMDGERGTVVTYEADFVFRNTHVHLILCRSNDITIECQHQSFVDDSLIERLRRVYTLNPTIRRGPREIAPKDLRPQALWDPNKPTIDEQERSSIFRSVVRY